MKKISRILTYCALALGVIGLAFTLTLWVIGEDNAALQDTTIALMFFMTYGLLALSIIAILYFLIMVWVKIPRSFMDSLKYIGVFVVIAVASYLLTDTKTPVLVNGGQVASASDTFIADFGIWMTYIILALSMLVVLFGGFLKKIIKK